MNNVIRGRDVSDAWKQSVVYLAANQSQAYNLVVEIENPLVDNLDVRTELNNILKSQNDQTVDTVANTIFPANLEVNCANRNEFYKRFLQLYPSLREIPENSKGTYFGRLVCWGYESQIRFNQVEKTIEKLQQVNHGRGKIRVRYEMGVYDPMLDHDALMGFPCMSFISVKIRGSAVDMTAIYRNQYFLQKAYGNYLGLGRLHGFIASQSGFNIGHLTCIATHASIGNITGDNMRKLRELSSSVVQLNLEI